MKAKASAAAAAAAAEDDAEPKKIRFSRCKRRRRHLSRCSSSSESPPRKRSKKHSKRVPDKKSKRSKAGGSSSRRRQHRSLSPSRSLGSSSRSPSSVARRSGSSCSSSSASERSVSPPPKSRSRDVRRKNGRGRDRERDRKGRKVRRSVSSSSTSASSGSSRSRGRSKSKSRKRRTVGGTKDDSTRDKMEKDYTDRRSSRSDMNVDEDVDRDEDKLAIAKELDNDIGRYKNNSELEGSPSKNANETEEMVPTSGGNSDAQDLELILRQKALENFRKFRAAATMGGKTDNGAAGKEALRDDSLQNVGTEVVEAAHFQSQGSRHSAGSPRSQNFGNGASRPWNQESSAGMRSCGAGSPRILEPADTGGPTQLKGRTEESTRLASQLLPPLDARNGRSVMQRLVLPPGRSASVTWKEENSAGMSCGAGSPRKLELAETGGRTQLKGRAVESTRLASQSLSPLDSRNSRSVMQRLGAPPGSPATVNQRLGGAGLNHVNGAPRVKSVVRIPARERLDGSTHTTPPRPIEDSSPVESSGKVGLPLNDTNKAEGTNGEDRKTSEAPASNGSVLSPAEDKSQARIEDKDGFQKKTFSRMHDGEAVEVSYKVYIPKKTPALAKRKLQR